MSRMEENQAAAVASRQCTQAALTGFVGLFQNDRDSVAENPPGGCAGGQAQRCSLGAGSWDRQHLLQFWLATAGAAGAVPSTGSVLPSKASIPAGRLRRWRRPPAGIVRASPDIVFLERQRKAHGYAGQPSSLAGCRPVHRLAITSSLGAETLSGTRRSSSRVLPVAAHCGSARGQTLLGSRSQTACATGWQIAPAQAPSHRAEDQQDQAPVPGPML